MWLRDRPFLDLTPDDGDEPLGWSDRTIIGLLVALVVVALGVVLGTLGAILRLW